jgi:hypothetical protein
MRDSASYFCAQVLPLGWREVQLKRKMKSEPAIEFNCNYSARSAYIFVCPMVPLLQRKQVRGFRSSLSLFLYL